MAYYVLGPGGAKHGPAELVTLNQWVIEGRIAPETLIEDIGSGVKMPARAVRGVQFANSSSPVSTIPTPLGRGIDPSIPSSPSMQSNYLRPGLGTGGSQRNLFLPNVDSKWALHGLLSAGGGLLAGILTWLIIHELHFTIGRFTILAFGLCVYGVKCGYTGINQGQTGRGALVIAANVLVFLLILALIIWGFSSW